MRRLSQTFGLLTLTLCIVASLLPGVASAQTTRTWGVGGAGGSGTWSTTNSNWFRAGTTSTWVQGDNAVFAGTSGTVTYTGTMTANNIAFDTANYTLRTVGSAGRLLVVNSFSGSGLSSARLVPGGSGGFGLSIPSGTANFPGIVSNSIGSFFKLGAGELVLSGSIVSPIELREGTLTIVGPAQPSNSVDSVAGSNTAAKLFGTGGVSSLSLNGIVAPGTPSAAGILTSIDYVPVTAGIGDGSSTTRFQFTQAGSPTWGSRTASGNDVLRLMGAVGSGAASLDTFGATNKIDIFLPASSGTFRGGFFTDPLVIDPLNGDTGIGNFEAQVANATYMYYAATPGGTTSYRGTSYSLLDAANVTRTTVQVDSATFDGGSGGTVTGGYTMQFVVVPEPGTMAMAGVGVATLVWAGCRRRRGCSRMGW